MDLTGMLADASAEVVAHRSAIGQWRSSADARPGTAERTPTAGRRHCKPGCLAAGASLHAPLVLTRLMADEERRRRLRSLRWFRRRRSVGKSGTASAGRIDKQGSASVHARRPRSAAETVPQRRIGSPMSACKLPRRSRGILGSMTPSLSAFRVLPCGALSQDHRPKKSPLTHHTPLLPARLRRAVLSISPESVSLCLFSLVPAANHGRPRAPPRRDGPERVGRRRWGDLLQVR
ncbi:hypothetical protein DFJ74DRAFT_496781 [Hyaloraphidium curvatum]|nr:hypothetical protein DFJ74DRAFT_496781 [Hyaloraphidium curvatum]